MTGTTPATLSSNRYNLMAVGLLALSMALTTTATALADSLFLANFPVTSLPVYLMVLHLVGVSLSLLLFASNQKQTHPRQLFFLHCFFGLLAFNAVVWAEGLSWLSIGLLCVIVHASATVINVATWAQTMGHVHTASAKSQVPLLAAGLTIGGSLSGVALILVAKFVTVQTAIFYIVLLLLIFAPAIFQLDRALKKQSKLIKHEPLSEPSVIEHKVVKRALDDPLVQFLAMVSFIFAIGSTFLDFQYKAILQNQPNAERIAFYLGGLHLVLNILVLTGQLALSKLMVQQVRIHRIFAFYPRFVMLAVASAVFMPLLLGAFFARITERTFRYLVLNASTDMFMGPMRNHFKTRAVWLTKGIASPLGTLVSLSFIMVFFQFTTPGGDLQVYSLYGATFFAFAMSLFFARKLEKKYQAFLGESLGMDALEDAKENVPVKTTEKASRSIGHMPRKGDEVGLVELEFLSASMPLNQRRKVLFRLQGQLTPSGTELFLTYIATEEDPSVLIMALRFLVMQKRQFVMPSRLVEHEDPLVAFLSRSLLQYQAGVTPLIIETDFQQLCFQLEMISNDDIKISKSLDHLRQERDIYDKLEVMIEQLMFGSPWYGPLPVMTYPKWRHLVHLYHLIKRHPIGTIGRQLLPPDAQMEFLKKALLSEKTHMKLWAVHAVAFYLNHRQMIEMSFFWAQHLKEDDHHYLLPLLEHPDPFQRTRALSLLYLCKIKFSHIKFDDHNLGEAIQRTTLDCMIGTGIRAETHLQRIQADKTHEIDLKEEAFGRLLDTQNSEFITLFFGMYGLIVGPIWAKQLYKKFAHGTHLTRADVVEYCRTQAESKLIEPMMMVLGSMHPEKTLQVLEQSLPRVKGSFLAYAQKHTRLAWFQDWLQLSHKQRTRLSNIILAMMHVKALKNLPPYLLYQIALLGRDSKASETDRIALKLSSTGRTQVNYPAGAARKTSAVKKKFEYQWLWKDLELLTARDNRLLTALLVLQSKSGK